MKPYKAMANMFKRMIPYDLNSINKADEQRIPPRASLIYSAKIKWGFNSWSYGKLLTVACKSFGKLAIIYGLVII